MPLNASLDRVLKYLGVVLPIVAAAVYLVGQHPLAGGHSFSQPPVLVHVLLASTIILQGCRFLWLLQKKTFGYVLLGAGALYAAEIVAFGLKIR